MTENAATEIGAQFLSEMLQGLGCSGDVSVHEDGENVRYQIDGEAEKLAAKVDLVSALSLLTGRVISKSGERYDCLLDFGGKFETRSKTLIQAAHELGEISAHSNQRIYVTSLTSAERKLMHRALVDSEAVTTRSDGRKLRRFIIEPTTDS